MGRGLLAVLVTLAALLAGVVAAAGPAQAHNVLRSSTPAAGSTVAVAPTEVVLTFDQPAVALGTEVLVTGPSGEVAQGRPRLVDESVTQPLAADAPAGRYTVDWRVTSADGHPIEGRFTFTATTGAEPSSTSTEPGPSTTRPTTEPPATTPPATTPSTALAGEEQDPASRAPLLWLGLAALLLAAAGIVALARRRDRTG